MNLDRQREEFRRRSLADPDDEKAQAAASRMVELAPNLGDPLILEESAYGLREAIGLGFTHLVLSVDCQLLPGKLWNEMVIDCQGREITIQSMRNFNRDLSPGRRGRLLLIQDAIFRNHQKLRLLDVAPCRTHFDPGLKYQQGVISRQWRDASRRRCHRCSILCNYVRGAPIAREARPTPSAPEYPRPAPRPARTPLPDPNPPAQGQPRSGSSMHSPRPFCPPKSFWNHGDGL